MGQSCLQSFCKGKSSTQWQDKTWLLWQLHGTADSFVLFVFVDLILLHCGEDIKLAQQDSNQDILCICLKMISRDNEKQWPFLVGLHYVTDQTTFQPEKPSENTMQVRHTVQRAPHASNPPLRPPSGVKWQTPGNQLFSPVPQMVTQQGANKWMTSCPSGFHRQQQIKGAEELRRRGINGRRGEKTPQSEDGQTTHPTSSN